MMGNELRFGFGENWQSFVDNALDAKRIGKAANSLRQILNVEHLYGKSFLDIGCGSGLFSLAACLLGAERVVAFDYDVNSVQASVALRAKSNIPSERWQIIQGSILDTAFLHQIDAADIVYSWGVLHHTGSLWEAIDQAVSKIKPGGIIALAIYNHQERMIGGSAMWWHIKRFYNHAPYNVRRLTEYAYVSALLIRDLITLRHFIEIFRRYTGGDSRGMDFWHDVRDWLGGFPYEYATIEAMFNYLHGKFDLRLEYLKACSGYGCNEFVFRQPAEIYGLPPCHQDSNQETV